MKTDLDLAIAIVRDAIKNTWEDIRANGMDEYSDGYISALDDIEARLVQRKAELYGCNEVEA